MATRRMERQLQAASERMNGEQMTVWNSVNNHASRGWSYRAEKVARKQQREWQANREKVKDPGGVEGEYGNAKATGRWVMEAGRTGHADDPTTLRRQTRGTSDNHEWKYQYLTRKCTENMASKEGL
eukprot:4686931-Pleurochrysis_carterae.AAC.1